MNSFERGCTIWLTGLSGAGKSTISDELVEQLRNRGRRVEVLDGDVIRTNLSQGLGFSREDRDTNIRRVGFVAHLLTRNGTFVIAAVISPYRAIRDENRRLIGDFVEVHVDASLETCIQRDVKGLYKKAIAGEIAVFTGVSDPYEPPLHPEVICHTENETPAESASRIMTRLEQLGYLESAVAATAGVGAYSAAEEAVIQSRLESLGYI